MPRIETAASLIAAGYVTLPAWAKRHKITRQMAHKYRTAGRLPAKLGIDGNVTRWFVPAATPKPDAVLPGRKPVA